MWPVAGAFCRGGVCGTVVVVLAASAELGVDGEELAAGGCC